MIGGVAFGVFMHGKVCIASVFAYSMGGFCFFFRWLAVFTYVVQTLEPALGRCQD